MDEGGILGKDVDGAIGRRKFTGTKGMRKSTGTVYAVRPGPVQYRSQSNLPSPSSGLYMPQNHVPSHSYQNYHTAFPYNYIRLPQLSSGYVGGTSIEGMGMGFHSASNSDFGYDEVNHDQNGTLPKLQGPF
jgi:hypothetical protein